MAVTYFATSSSGGGTSMGSGYYKDVTVTGCQVGDLIVAGGVNANYAAASTTRSVATQSGSTSAWTATATSPVNNADCDTHLGYATVATAGTVVVRVTLRGPAAMGAAAWLIPAAEWSGTPAFTTVSNANATGKLAATLAATSGVFLLGADWNTVDVTTTTLTPTGTLNTDAYVAGAYQVYAASWAAQAAGTRDYGWAVDPGATDYAIVLCAVPAAAVAGGRPEVWTGSAWVKKPGKVWSGSAWVEKPWKRWSGSAWVTLP